MTLFNAKIVFSYQARQTPYPYVGEFEDYLAAGEFGAEWLNVLFRRKCQQNGNQEQISSITQQSVNNRDQCNFDSYCSIPPFHINN